MVNSKTAIKQLKILKEKGRKMRLAAEDWENEFQTLIAIILSARTRDETTIKVCEKMFEKFPTAEDFSKLNIENIKRLIYNINFYENKSKYLYDMTNKLIEKYGGKVPHDFDKIVELPGVGRKTANVFLTEIRADDAIGVDTHVNYCSRYLGWTNAKENQSHKIEEDLKMLFPKKYWNSVNSTLVRFGKTYTSRMEKNKLLDEVNRVK